MDPNMTFEEFVDQYLWLFLILSVWEFIWKAVALWKAARNSSRGWFATLLVVNSLGIIPILYIFLFSKTTKKK